MSRDPRCQKLYNSKRWKLLRRAYLQQHPLCERCQREGFVRAAVDVHHKTPIESAKTEQEMEYLAYNIGGNNLEALCIPCHIKTHQEMRSHCKEQVKANKQRARQRFLQMNDPNWQPPSEQLELPAHSESEYVDYEEVTEP